MFMECQALIEHNSQHFNFLGYWEVDSCYMNDVATRSLFLIAMSRASDLSWLSCRLYCRYHCLVSVVHSARMDSLVMVLSALSMHGEMQLHVVGLLTILDAVVRDDVGH